MLKRFVRFYRARSTGFVSIWKIIHNCLHDYMGVGHCCCWSARYTIWLQFGRLFSWNLLIVLVYVIELDRYRHRKYGGARNGKSSNSTKNCTLANTWTDKWTKCALDESAQSVRNWVRMMTKDLGKLERGWKRCPKMKREYDANISSMYQKYGCYQMYA